MPLQKIYLKTIAAAVLLAAFCAPGMAYHYCSDLSGGWSDSDDGGWGSCGYCLTGCNNPKDGYEYTCFDGCDGKKCHSGNDDGGGDKGWWHVRCRRPNSACACAPSKTCANYPPDACGPLSDGCALTLNCYTCPAGQTCYLSKCCTPKTCAADYPGQCGWKTNGCGGALNCTCPSGICNAGKCCAVKTCAADYPGQCGSFPDGCGDNITCGCATGQRCVSGACYPPYDTILKVRCASGTQSIAGSTVPVSDVHVRKSGKNYDAVLVAPGSPDSSCVSVRLSTTTMRMMKLP